MWYSVEMEGLSKSHRDVTAWLGVVLSAHETGHVFCHHVFSYCFLL
jgi:hypothetical protein